MKKLLVGLLAIGSLSVSAQTVVKYSGSDETYKLKDAVVKVNRAGAYIVLELDNGDKVSHSKIGGYRDAKELATDLLNPKSTLKVVIPRGWTEFHVK